jgi:pilus assembly protein CpaB
VNRRLIGLLLALVLAGIATFLIIRYVTAADERAREDEELAQVFIAQQDIPAGTAADEAIAQGLIAQDEVPTRTVPEGAVGDLGQLSGQVATVPIYAGEIIVGARFGETVAQATGLLEIPDGLEAVTLEADVVRGVAGFVQPQDTVSLVGTMETPLGQPGDTPEDAEGTTGRRTQYLVTNVTVLAIGERVLVEDETGEEGAQISNARYLFTLAMEPADIEKAVFATQEGTVWFTLVPEDQEPAETGGRSANNVFS